MFFPGLEEDVLAAPCTCYQYWWSHMIVLGLIMRARADGYWRQLALQWCLQILDLVDIVSSKAPLRSDLK